MSLFQSNGHHQVAGLFDCILLKDKKALEKIFFKDTKFINHYYDISFFGSHLGSFTPLLWALYINSIDCFQVLLNYGADTSLAVKGGRCDGKTIVDFIRDTFSSGENLMLLYHKVFAETSSERIITESESADRNESLVESSPIPSPARSKTPSLRALSSPLSSKPSPLRPISPPLLAKHPIATIPSVDSCTSVSLDLPDILKDIVTPRTPLPFQSPPDELRSNFSEPDLQFSPLQFPDSFHSSVDSELGEPAGTLSHPPKHDLRVRYRKNSAPVPPAFHSLSSTSLVSKSFKKDSSYEIKKASEGSKSEVPLYDGDREELEGPVRKEGKSLQSVLGRPSSESDIKRPRSGGRVKSNSVLVKNGPSPPPYIPTSPPSPGISIKSKNLFKKLKPAKQPERTEKVERSNSASSSAKKKIKK